MDHKYKTLNPKTKIFVKNIKKESINIKRKTQIVYKEFILIKMSKINCRWLILRRFSVYIVEIKRNLSKESSNNNILVFM